MTAMTRLGATAAILLAARQFFRNWGTTKAECAMPLPGDSLVGQPAVVTTEGITIDRPPEAVWPWLVQIGLDRAGLYAYETLHALAGLDYHDADRIHPEWQHLAVGDTVRLAPRGWLGLDDGIVVTVAQIEEGRSIVLRTRGGDSFWDAVWSLNVAQHGDDGTRLLIRTRVPLRRPGAVVGAELIAPPKAFVTRAILRGVKHRAESEPAPRRDPP
ncbi:SRPBCC family protein [Mycolicibacterium sp. ELW1]|uniref:SRPBCC family protein n=1 Tax=Mycobacteriaceae TaxID=1762 RepID=UPI0011EDCC3F|nr:SRPBCC family protein [Mycobacterium sp. ELW1]QEN14853.1 SRPBCC family protein [Mycobacterium sp. ELW1]